jgi:chitodextrinase
VYGAADVDQMATVMSLSKQRGAGYVYVTDDVLANPYDTLPVGDYWSIQQALATEVPGTLVPPTAPQVLDSVEHYSTMIDFDWVASTSPTSSVVAYDFFRDGVYLGSVPATSTTFRAVGLTPQTSYVFTVAARDAFGLVSPPSNAREETTTATYSDPPTRPTNVYVDGTGFTSTTLRWQPGPEGRRNRKPPIASFVVLQNNRPILQLPSTSRRVSIGGLAPGSQYGFSVVSVDETGDHSRPSSTVFASTGRPPDGQLIGAPTVTHDLESVTYRAEYLVPFAFRRVFIATDTPGAPCWFTGSEPQMCADYAIENDRLLRYVGTGGDWEWETVRAVAAVVDGLGYSWSISPSDIGTPVAALFNANGYAPNSYCGEGVVCTSIGPPLPYE